MDVDLYREEAVIYLYEDEISELLIGDSLYRPAVQTRDESKPMDISIQSLNENNKDVSHYDDVLNALRNAVKQLHGVKDEDGVNPDEYKKLKQTYIHYHNQREKYR